MSLVITPKPLLRLTFKAEKRFRISAMLLCIFMIVVDHYFGNVFTTTAVLMYSFFLFPAIYLNRYVQVTYFYYVQQPIIAFRLMCIVIIAAMTLVWSVAIVDYILDPPVFPKEERLKELMGESYQPVKN
ncbi:hypothetical protein KJI95_02165 [Shewanella sp. JM162201]|uniref:Uncharacterized protein n=1 Tax=Shewanella jiangmenensis TaxID=2837387 RepID=A0ABS5UYV5_9GAMM|nr:hypothetical protein [Shewanella jiangmenensis]MBT1443334.1 hypothetical protein [Shewanella jiangmenensis]